MKKLAIFLFLFIIIVLVSLFWVFVNTKPVSSETKYINFRIPSGYSATQIGSNLYKQGLIKNPTVFKVYVKFSGLSDSIQSGDYRLSPSFNLFQIVNQLSKSPLSVKVTIPEGLTREEIATKYTESLDKDASFTNLFLKASEGSEGYLFPDTYFISSNATPAGIVAKMKDEFEKRTSSLKPTPNQIILASIIEKETKSVEERPIVSGILMNRLESSMALQVDVAPETYKVTGLPKNPIANPGLISITAAVHPVETEFWYYLHDDSGQIHYAKTLDEHNANIRKYLW